MKKYSPLSALISIIFILSIVSIISFIPSSAAASDNVAAPKITYIGTDDNLVNTWGDNAIITFQVEDENGHANIKSVEIGIYNYKNQREEYDNLAENIKPVSSGGDMSTYSYEFNPDNKFEPGQVDVKITATDEENHRENRKKEDLLEVTDDDISVKTENADNITTNSATFNASIDLAGYDKVEAKFFFDNNPDDGNFDNETSWENTSSADYENTVKSLQPYQKYEFRASIRLPENNFEDAFQSDNGSILTFSTYPENAKVTTGKVTYKDKSHITNRKPTLHSSIEYGGYDTVNITFQYRGGNSNSWSNTGWNEDYSKENYSYTFSKGLSEATVYEYRSKIEFGNSKYTFYDNGSISSFTTGGVNVLSTIPPEVEVNTDQDVTIEVANKYSNRGLRDVIVETTNNRFSDKSETIGTVNADSSQSATFTYHPLNSGEKTLEFSIEYRVYTQDNEFLYSDTQNIDLSTEVTGTEYENAIDLRISSENPPLEWIFNGETYTAQIEVHNQRPTEVSGIKVVGENIEDYGVGSLSGDESTTIQIRVPPENYEVGKTNKVRLRAIHELGVSKPLTLKFQVRDENAPVGVYLIRSNSPIYQGEKLKFTLVVAASQDSNAQDLVVKSPSENVVPQGYWVGEEMKNLTEQQVSTEEAQQATGIQQLLGPGAGGVESGEQEEERAIVGKKLYFEADELKPGDNSLKFRVTYELGNKVVKREFEVNFRIQHTPGIRLVLSEPVKAEKGNSTTISMEITNEKSIEVQAVRAVPPENVQITPQPYYWIGSMEPEAFLPVEFTLQTEGLEDGDNLTFYPLYRVGNEEMKGSPLIVQVNLKDSKETPFLLYGAIATAIIILVILFFYFYWYRG